MTRKNFYVLVDKEINKVLSHPIKLPENWQNIHGLSFLSDEKISDLTWANQPNFAWIKFDSEFPSTFEFAEDWLEFAKNSIKNEYANQRWDVEKQGILYNNILIDTDDRTKSAILLKLQSITPSSQQTFSWKYNNSIIEFTSSDIINIANHINDYIQQCFNTEAELIKKIDAVESILDLSQFELDVNWPLNVYE